MAFVASSMAMISDSVELRADRCCLVTLHKIGPPDLIKTYTEIERVSETGRRMGQFGRHLGAPIG